MSKYAICNDCYYNNKSPEICEGCSSGDQFEPQLGGDFEAPTGVARKVKVIKVHTRKATKDLR